MRITNGMIARTYEKSLTRNLARLNESFAQMSSQKKVARASDDPAAAMKILKSLHRLSDIQQFATNIDDTVAWVNNTESTVSMVNDIIKSAQETITAANNSGTLSADDRSTYANALKSLQEELIQTLNTTFGGRYIFGGAQEGPAPFKVGTAADGAGNEGKLMFYDYNAEEPGYILFSSINTGNASAKNLTLPVDVGLGMRLDENGKVVKGTALEAQTSAIDMLGVNMNESGCTSIFDMLTSAITKLTSDGTQGLGDELRGAQEAQNSVLKVMTGIGEKSKMLRFLSDRNETLTLNQETRLSGLQDVDLAEAVMEYQTRQTVYTAALSVGTKILQSSLIDFLK